MGNFGKILIYILVLGAIFLWFSSMLKTCNFGSDKVADNDTNALIGEDEINNAIVEDTSALLFENDIIQPEEEPAGTSADYGDQSNSAPGRSDSYNNSGRNNDHLRDKDYSPQGQYMIIAGNYLIRSNAEIMVDKLQSMGYTSASIVVFERSQYHTVLASRLNDYEEALDISNALRRQGIETYVKRRN